MVRESEGEDRRHTENMRPSMEDVRVVLTRAYCNL